MSDRPAVDPKFKANCIRCHRPIAVDREAREQLDELGFGSQLEMVCASCIEEMDLGDDVYNVKAGTLYRRFGTFAVKLWPVGTFH